MTVAELIELLAAVPDDYVVWIISDYGEGELTNEMLHVSRREESLLIDTGGSPSSPGSVPIDEWIEGGRKR